MYHFDVEFPAAFHAKQLSNLTVTIPLVLIQVRLYLSPRWNGPLIKVNCAALSESLLESELFGHEMGAFTGAQRKRAGRFELADTGTLILDEIANASPAVQEKVLRVIEYGEFERVGGTETLQVDVRVVAAANADLPALAQAGDFRADLLDRLAFDVITIPPLRARPRDIISMAESFAVETSQDLGLDTFAGFSDEAKQSLEAYDWPGNVRELRNVVERSVFYGGQTITDPSGSDIMLTNAEFNLFAALAKAPNRVLSRDFLLDAVSRDDEAPSDRLIDVLISRVRKKIEAEPKKPKLIVTVPGCGYKFTSAP